MPATPVETDAHAARAMRIGIGALFFVYFTYVGLFSPYLALYLAGVGYPIAQIGWLMAVPQAMMDAALAV